MPASATRTQISPIAIKVNGSDLQPSEISHVIDVTVEHDLFLPSVCIIRLLDIYDNPTAAEEGFCTLLDQDRFPIGASLEVLMGREAMPGRVFTGEITAIELELDQRGDPILTIRGYDKSHRLRRERKSRTFENVADSDLVKEIAREYGLSAQTDSTSVIHQYIIQDNLTDWDFLQARAARLGYELSMHNGTLRFRRPSATEQAPTQIFGESLLRLRVRLSTSTQVSQVTVQGWDPGAKQAINGQANSATVQASIGESRNPSQLANSSFGTGKFVVAEKPVATTAEADALAQAVYDEIAGGAIQLEGVCLGDPAIAPGKKITLQGLGRRFSGGYYLSAVTHRANRREGYLTFFTVSGRRPSTLSALLGGASDPQRTGYGVVHPGVVIGQVTDNKDPQERGRVKVKFPWLGNQESDWARLASPMAGGSRGLFYLPEVNDEVLVAFEHGDINRPYVVGAVWNGKDKPPINAAQAVGPTGKVDKRILKSRLGHTITLDDSDQSPNITIVDKTGQNTIKIDALTNEISIKAQGNLKLEATGQVTLKGATVNVESSGPLNLKGAVGNVEASGPMNIKGALIKLN